MISKAIKLNKRQVKINARKFDGKIHRTWNAKLIEQNESTMLFVGEFEKEVDHPKLGVIRRGTISYEYYWLDRWYSIFRFHEPNGTLRNYYCNINMPPTFKDLVLDYIDLDLDILVWEDFTFEVLDEDEFTINAKKYGYPEEVIESVRSSLASLKHLINKRQFPFSENVTIKI